MTENLNDELLAAAKAGNVNRLTELLATGVDVNCGYKFTETPLLWAASRGHAHCIELLLKAGANSELMSGHAETPLSIAIVCDRESSVQALINGGANVNIHVRDGRTPLMMAVRKPALLDRLLAAGADIHAIDNAGMTALIHAALLKCEYACERLVELGAKTDRLRNRMPDVADRLEAYQEAYRLRKARQAEKVEAEADGFGL